MLRSEGIVSGFARGSEKGFSGFIVVVVVVVDGVGEGRKESAICLGLAKSWLYYQLKKKLGEDPKNSQAICAEPSFVIDMLSKKKSQATHPRCMIFTAILALLRSSSRFATLPLYLLAAAV